MLRNNVITESEGQDAQHSSFCPRQVHLLKDYGIPLIGMKTGGGSCAILYNPTAEGFGYRYSTHRHRLNNTKGENIDSGINPTYELDKDDFFDVQKVTQLVESYYAK